MTIAEIEQAILDTVVDVYHKRYVGKLKVERLQPVGLQVTFGMNNEDKPIVVAAELKDIDFLKFLRQELRDRHWHTSQYFIGVKTYPDNCSQQTKSCCK